MANRERRFFMTHPFTIDELEREIIYLREQNQKLIKELSRVVEENRDLREEWATKRKRLKEVLEGPETEEGKNQADCRVHQGEECDLFCLN
jgi:regulator of replication initiation timing